MGKGEGWSKRSQRVRAMQGNGFSSSTEHKSSLQPCIIYEHFIQSKSKTAVHTKTSKKGNHWSLHESVIKLLVIDVMLLEMQHHFSSIP